MTGKISVIEADMGAVIEEYQHDPAVAFAHCISRDYKASKNMSAGVATVFREKFGKPQLSHRKSQNLAIQQQNNSAIIYSLITKAIYSDKPTIENYSEAFRQLEEDFTSKQLKTLICSPLGCVRDRIPIDIFAKNLMKLQERTGATVQIIVCDENAGKNLRNGLSIKKFINKLEQTFTSLTAQARALEEPLTNPSLPLRLTSPEEPPVDPSQPTQPITPEGPPTNPSMPTQPRPLEGPPTDARVPHTSTVRRNSPILNCAKAARITENSCPGEGKQPSLKLANDLDMSKNLPQQQRMN